MRIVNRILAFVLSGLLLMSGFSSDGWAGLGAMLSGFVGLSPIMKLSDTLQVSVSGAQSIDWEFTSRNLPSGAPITGNLDLVPDDLTGFRVFPNPWRSDRHAGKSITFDYLPEGSTVKLFAIDGHWIKTLSSSHGIATWQLTNESGDSVASGIYLYTIMSTDGTHSHGKLAVIR